MHPQSHASRAAPPPPPLPYTEPTLCVSQAAHRVTRLTLVPSLLRALLSVSPHLGDALPHLRWWTLSGEALPRPLASAFVAAAPPNAILLNLYGSTETAGQRTRLGPGD